jgi:hypothetical protein
MGGVGFLRVADGSAILVTDNIIVSNYGFEGPGGIGFYTTTNATVSVTNNSIRNNSYNRDGPHFAVTGVGAKYMTGGSYDVFNNIFYANNVGDFSWGQLGVRFCSLLDVRIVSNYIGGGNGAANKYSVQFDGVWGCGDTMDSFVFSGNEIDGNNQTGGTRGECSKSFTFTGNKLYNYGKFGYVFRAKGNQSPIIIEGNEVYSSFYAGSTGIGLSRPSNIVKIRNNTTRNGYNGISVNGSAGLGVDDYTIIASN